MSRYSVMLVAALWLTAGFDQEVSAQVDQRLAGTAMFNACAIAVTESGDAFLSHYLSSEPGQPLSPWQPAGNLFGTPGVPPASPLVGLTYVNNSGPVIAVCRNGDFLLLGWNGCDEVGASPGGNIFTEAGRPLPGVEIVTVGWGAGLNGRHFLVGASNGDVYRKDGSGILSPYWQFAGTVQPMPTASVRNSWGSLKSFHR